MPTDCEWMYLEDTLGMITVAQQQKSWRGTDEGGKLKEIGTTHWNSPNAGATNSSGFTGLPGGYRNSGGNYDTFEVLGVWWGTPQGSYDSGWRRSLGKYDGRIDRHDNNTGYGYSVRCLKDSGSVQNVFKKDRKYKPIKYLSQPYK